ncbi:PAS domain S-box protein [Spirochaeta cellobiosiphila]|uniref:PAS domain S-box protein n=1 Tax=Spirochaeta cellobiosiphila TaxID=504483 RepID=UPI001B7FB9C1|nr:PAS domain S-box protein [Spirochaeta cellobiosiphila]
MKNKQNILEKWKRLLDHVKLHSNKVMNKRIIVVALLIFNTIVAFSQNIEISRTPNVFSNQSILDIKRTEDGMVWLLTSKGLLRWTTNHFEVFKYRYDGYLTEIVITNDDNILILNNEGTLYEFNQLSGQFYLERDINLFGKNIKHLYYDKSSDLLYLSTPTDLYRYADGPIINIYSDNSNKTIFLSNGQIYISKNGKLFWLNRVTPIELFPEDWKEYNDFYDVYIESPSSLYVATVNNGLVHLTDNKNLTIDSDYIVTQIKGFDQDRLICTTLDGNVLMYRDDKLEKVFNGNIYDVEGLFIDEFQTIWSYSDNNFSYLAINGMSNVNKYILNSDDYKAVLHFDSKNNDIYYIDSLSNLVLLNLQDNKKQIMYPDLGVPLKTLIYDRAMILQYPHSIIYYSLDTNTIRTMLEVDKAFIKESVYSDDLYVLTSDNTIFEVAYNRSRKFYIDNKILNIIPFPQNGICIFTENDSNYILKKGRLNEFRNISFDLFPSSPIDSYYLDKEDRIWMSFKAAGIAVYNFKTDKFKKVDKNIRNNNYQLLWRGDQLLSSSLDSINVYKMDNSLDTISVQSYMHDMEITKGISFADMGDDHHLINTRKGLLIDRLNEDRHQEFHKPSIYIDKVSLMKRNITEEYFNTLTQGFELYSDESIMIRYGYLKDQSLQHFQLAFRLKGFEDQWHYSDINDYVEYKNLRTGNYTFQLKLKDQNDNWLDESKEVYINIKPFWWRKIVFILLIIFIIITIIIIYLQYPLHRKKEKYEELEKKFKAISESATDAILFANQSGKIFFWNSGAENIFGYKSDQIINTNVEIILPEWLDYTQKKGENGLFVEQIYESFAYRKNGLRFDCDLSYSSWNIGKKQYHTFLIRDISERKEKEKALVKSNNYLIGYKTALDESAMVIGCTPEGIITIANGQFYEITGYTIWEAIGRPIADFIGDDTAKEIFHPTQGITSSRKNWHGVIENINRDGELYVLESSVIPIYDETAEVVELVAVSHDITDLHKALKEAKAAEQAKSSFLANMSHEIRTPLNGIIGFIGLLSNTSLAIQQKEFVDTIKSSAKNLLAIINDILDFSKIESQKLEIESIPFNPITEFEHIVELFIAGALEKNIVIHFFVDPGLPILLLGDPLRLKQIITNLLSNAVKFTKNGGSIQISIRLGDMGEDYAVLEFSVKDNGIGIPKEQQKSIFDSFHQADSSISRKFGGTGLGLAICASLTEIMGGKLKLKSEQNEGSLFYFDIKFDKPEAALSYQSSIGIKAQRVAYIDSESSKLPTFIKHYLTVFSKELETMKEIPLDISSYDLLVIENIPVNTDKIKQLNSNNVPLFVINDHHVNTKKSDSLVLNYPHFLTNIVDCIHTAINGTHTVTPQSTNTEDNSQLKGHVLVVEDNEINQNLMKIMLEELGLTVSLAPNGLHAIESRQNNDFDMIFMDISMPEMDGEEATQLIIEYERKAKQQHCPIIALTAHAIKGDKERFMNIGMDDYLSKPIEMESLVMIVQKYLSVENQGDKLNRQETAKVLGISIETLDLLFQEFISRKKEFIDDLGSAIEHEDLDQVHMIAHKLKGLALNLRLDDIGSIASEIELAAKNKEDLEYDKLFGLLQSEYQIIEKMLLEIL